MSTGIDQFQAALTQLQRGELGAQAFSQQVRTQTALLQALPPRYGEVLLQLLTRLESSALFSEESCSFSQSALFDNLQGWADKAREQLAKAP